MSLPCSMFQKARDVLGILAGRELFGYLYVDLNCGLATALNQVYQPSLKASNVLIGCLSARVPDIIQTRSCSGHFPHQGMGKSRIGMSFIL